MDTSRAYEEAYLNTVLEKLRQRIRVLEDKTRVGQQNLSDAGFKLWDEITHVIRDFDDVAALTLYDADITRQEDEHRSALIELRNMLSLYQIPYFGRLDFVSDFDGEKEQVYIGAHAFMDRKSFTPYVYDWRTPIASMYYDSEIGPASFLSPGGEETGEITLMRRYRIRGGKLEFMYDAATGDEGRGDLVIFGPAGSGKTSVGIHRFAYLLYRFRDHLSNKNFVILSRNGMFSSYIGDILPELGEKRLPEAVLGLLTQIDDFREDGMRKLLRIAADGKVDDNEIAAYEDAMQQLTMLVEQALALGFAK